MALAILAPTQSVASPQDAPRGLAEVVASRTGEFSAAACEAVTITSSANGRLVSAELSAPGGDAGMLRARATAQGPWELFYVCFDGSNSTITSLANGRYVSAELSCPGTDNGMLRARATTAGPWERFSFASCGSNCVTIRSTANGRLVSAELSAPGADAGMLRARATAVGPWERFR